MSDYHGYATKSFTTPFFTLEVTTEVGPRFVRLIPAGTTLNLFAELPTFHWTTEAGDLYPLGGHRLWVSPERPAITYLPDMKGCKLAEKESGFVLSREDDFQDTHYSRTIEVTFDAHSPRMTVKHTLLNRAQAPLLAGPWGITMFRLGSRVFLPFSDQPADPFTLLGNRNLALWPYTRLDDPRLKVTDKGVSIVGLAQQDACKVGIYSPLGWAAIEFPEGYTLVKRVAALPAENYPDFNTNWQCYVRDMFIELETLGKLGQVQPGESVSITEEWELLKGSLQENGLV
ncbi:MAG: hypothetical protein VB013_02605 [Anaerolineaceae bacterium]|nr:hypothetical protein [Anaerolineaceae bacterium]